MNLYFDKSIDSFVIDFYSADCVLVCESYEKKGYKDIMWQSEDKRILLKIHSNIGYRSASYLYFTMTVDGKPMLNLENFGEYFLDTPERFDVIPSVDNWRELMSMIVTIYKEREKRNSLEWLSNQFETCLTQIEKYIDNSLKTTKTSPFFELKQYSIKNPLLKCNDRTICAKVIADKLSNLLNSQEISEVAGISFIDLHIQRICEKAIKILSDVYKSYYYDHLFCSKTEIESYEKCIDSIYEYSKRSNNRKLFLLNF